MDGSLQFLGPAGSWILATVTLHYWVEWSERQFPALGFVPMLSTQSLTTPKAMVSLISSTEVAKAIAFCLQWHFLRKTEASRHPPFHGKHRLWWYTCINWCHFKMIPLWPVRGRFASLNGGQAARPSIGEGEFGPCWKIVVLKGRHFVRPFFPNIIIVGK